MKTHQPTQSTRTARRIPGVLLDAVSFVLLATASLCPATSLEPAGAAASTARWIWSDLAAPAPNNRFTWFRKVVELDQMPADATLHLAADSNARVWINGQIVRRKHAGLYVSSPWVNTDASWKCLKAPEYVEHEKQIPGVFGGKRIRYSVVVDGAKALGGNLNAPSYDDSQWTSATLVEDGPWPSKLMDVDETGWINPEGVVGPGYADRYITRAGAQSFEFPDERTARWLSLHVHFAADGQVALSDVGVTRSQYPINPAGTFDCGNQRMAEIVRLCLIHAEVTMSDTYVDTPGREDGQWIEDNRPRAILAAGWFGDNQLRRFMIRTFGQGQGKDGQFHPFAPSNFPSYPARYDWSVQWVATLGQTDQAKAWLQTREKMIAAFRKYHVVPAKDDLPAHVGDIVDPTKPNLERGYCQAGQTIAIISGLLSRAEAVADLSYAFQDPDGSPGPGVKRWNNPTYGYRSLRALSDVGMGRKAVNHVIERDD